MYRTWCWGAVCVSVGLSGVDLTPGEAPDRAPPAEGPACLCLSPWSVWELLEDEPVPVVFVFPSGRAGSEQLLSVCGRDRAEASPWGQ